MDRLLELNDIIGDLDKALALPEVTSNPELFERLCDMQANFMLERMDLI